MQTTISFLGGLMLGLTIIYPQVSKSEDLAKTYQFSLDVCHSRISQLESEAKGMLMNKD